MYYGGTLNDPTDQDYHIDEPNIDISSHIVPTKANKYLPPNFYEQQARGKPMWWIKRYLEGSFDYSEGMVYPDIIKTFTSPFTIETLETIRCNGLRYKRRNSYFIWGYR